MKAPLSYSYKLCSATEAVPFATEELTMTMMTACMIHCGSASTSTSAIIRVAPSADMPREG